MPSNALRSKKELQDFLANKARANQPQTPFIPPRYARYTPEELFKSYKLAKMDNFGSFSSAYGEFGRSVGFSIGVDFASFIIPNNPWFAFTLTGSVDAERLKESMIILQKIIPGSNQKQTRLIGNRPIAKFRPWISERPICLMPFEGEKTAATGSLLSLIHI